MYFSLFKTNYVPKFFTYYQYKNIFKKTKQKLQDTVKRKKNQLYANDPGFTTQSSKIRRNTHKFGRYIFTGTIHCIKDTP